MSRKLRELKAKYGVTDKTTNVMNDMDPTTNKKYMEWLFRVRFVSIGNGKYKISDTFPSTLKTNVRVALTWFERNVNGRVPVDYRDINKFKTVTEFLGKVSEWNVPTRTEIKESVRVVLDNERWKIVVPLSFEASKLYGMNTRWCTTQKTYYNNYTRNGLLYYIIDKTLNRKFGLPINNNANGTPSFNSFFNNEDASLNLSNIKAVYGSNFDVVVSSIRDDFATYTNNRLKRKALDDAIQKIQSTRTEFIRTKLNNTRVDELLNSLVDEINVLNNGLI